MRAFGRCLDHEGGAFRNGISALLKESAQSPKPHLPSEDPGEGPEEGAHPALLAPSSWTPSLQSCENLISIVYKLPSL